MKTVYALRADVLSAHKVAKKLSEKEVSRQTLFNKIMALSEK